MDSKSFGYRKIIYGILLPPRTASVCSFCSSVRACRVKTLLSEAYWSATICEERLFSMISSISSSL